MILPSCLVKVCVCLCLLTCFVWFIDLMWVWLFALLVLWFWLLGWMFVLLFACWYMVYLLLRVGLFCCYVALLRFDCFDCFECLLCVMFIELLRLWVGSCLFLTGDIILAVYCWKCFCYDGLLWLLWVVTWECLCLCWWVVELCLLVCVLCLEVFLFGFDYNCGLFWFCWTYVVLAWCLFVYLLIGFVFCIVVLVGYLWGLLKCNTFVFLLIDEFLL